MIAHLIVVLFASIIKGFIYITQEIVWFFERKLKQKSHFNIKYTKYIILIKFIRI